MFIVLLKDFIGSDLHLVSDLKSGEFYFSNEIPDESFLVGKKNIEITKDLLCAFRISGINISTDAPIQFMKFAPLVPPSFQKDIKWQQVMPKKVWENWVQGILDQIKSQFENINWGYYNNIFCKSHEFLNNLDQIKINEGIRQKYILREKNPSIMNHLKSFRPSADGFAQKIVYDMEHTISGRLKISDGFPQLLVLRKDLRNIITSRYGNEGSVWMIDLISIEPRIALKLADRQIPDDIYLDISTNLFNKEKLTREQIKIFVLSAMFGAGADIVSEQTKISKEDCRLYYIPKIKEYFKINEISKKLFKECSDSNGKILNGFGKSITVLDRRPHKLYNHLVQSTAVDVALILFYNIYQKIKGMKINPIGVIHDCLLLDVMNGEEDRLKEIIEESKFIKEIDAVIPVEIKKLI